MIRFTVLILPLLLAGCFSQPPAPAVDRSTSAASRAAPDFACPAAFRTWLLHRQAW